MSEATFSLSEAARRCGVSRTTLQGNIDALISAGAARTNAGWQIPVSALISLGYMPRTSPPESAGKQQPTLHSVQETVQQVVHPENADVQALKLENAVLKERLKAAQGVAAERQVTIETLQQAMRLIEPPQTPTESNTPAATEPTHTPEPKKRGWWPFRGHS